MAAALLVRAQQAGALSRDVAVADLVASASGIAQAAIDQDQTDRLLTTVRKGITVPSPGPGRRIGPTRPFSFLSVLTT